MRVLLLYATRRNSTAEVAQFIGDILADHKIDVTVANVETHTGDGTGYDAYIFGTSIYNGMWLQPIVDKIRKFSDVIANKPVWTFMLCVRILEEGGEAHIREHYIPERILRKLNIQDQAIFAGKLFIEDVDFDDRWTLAVRYDGIKQPTEYQDDYRDWDAIRAWADNVAQKMLTLEEA